MHTPWKVATSAVLAIDTGPFLEDSTGTTIGRIFSGDDFSVAESTVHAVNSHAQLLEALEGLLGSGRGPDEIAHALDIQIERVWAARAAIQKAKQD